MVSSPDSPGKRAIIQEAGYHAVMVSICDSYLAPFAMLLKATPFQSGLITTVPSLLGSLMQLAGCAAGERGIPRRLILTLSAFMQTVMLVLLTVLSFAPETGYGFEALLVLAVLLQCAAGFGCPAWFDITGDAVPLEERGDFWARRGRVMNISNLLIFLVSGSVLHLSKSSGSESLGFSVLFAIAVAGKLVSVWKIQGFERGIEKRAPSICASERIEPGARVPLQFLLLFYFGVAVSGPYVSYYLLNGCGFTYAEFSLLLVMTLVAQAVAAPKLGRLLDIHGPRPLMFMGACTFGAIPLLWLGSSSFLWVAACHVAAGITGSMLNIAILELMMQGATPRDRARWSSTMGIVTSTGMLGGGLFGGAVLSAVGTSTFGFSLLFSLSAILRLVSVSILVPFLPVRLELPIGSFRPTRSEFAAGTDLEPATAG